MATKVTHLLIAPTFACLFKYPLCAGYFPTSRWTFLQIGSANHFQAQGPALPALLCFLSRTSVPSHAFCFGVTSGETNPAPVTATGAHPSLDSWEGRG